MLNFRGIVYRLWAVCPFLAATGGMLLLFAKNPKDDRERKENKIAGWGALLLAVFLLLNYGAAILNPEVVCFEGTFESEYRNSRVAPPLPFTMEYNFREADGTPHCLYLDVLSKKEIIPEGFEKGQVYTIWYESGTNILLRAEPKTE